MEIDLKPKERNIFLSEQVNQESIEKVIKKIIEINDSDEILTKQSELFSFTYKPKPIKIYIDSFGGNVYQCFGLLSVMEKSKTEIHTICTGAAMSAGFMILISGHRRYGYKLSTTLYHTVGSFVGGPLKELEDDVNESKRLQRIVDRIVLEKTKITKDKIKQVYVEKLDWFIGAEESLKLGIIDEII